MQLPWQKKPLALNSPRDLPGLALWLDSKDVSSLRNDAGAQPVTTDGIKLASDKSGNSSTNVLCLNGVAGNYATAPDSAALSITGDITLIAQAMLTDWTPGTAMCLVGKEVGDPQRSYWMEIDTAGTISISWTTTGSIASVLTMTSTVAITVTDLASKWVQATLDVDNGSGSRVAKFYVSDDGVTWVQLGTTVTTAGATSIADTTAVLSVGARGSGGGQRMVTGNIMRARILNGYDGAGSVVFDANFSLPAKLAPSFTESSSNAATVTINTSGATGARISGARDLYQGTAANQPILTIAASGNYLTFDGSNDYLKAAAFALAQPETVYFVGSQVTWTDTDSIYDGSGASNRMKLGQATPTPNIVLFGGGSDAAANTGLATATNGIVTAVFNGASSSLRVNRGTATTGNPGTNAANGFTLGSRQDGGANANITAQEVLVYSGAHDKATQERVIAMLARNNRIALT